MSRIGKLPIIIPAGVTVTLKDDKIVFVGKDGKSSSVKKVSVKTTKSRTASKTKSTVTTKKPTRKTTKKAVKK